MRLEEFDEVSVILQSGVYALCKRDVVIYVGKSKSLYQRIYAHRNLANRSAKGQRPPSWWPASLKGIVFDRVFVRPCHVDELDRLEAEMIDKYKPKYNVSLANGLKVRAPINLQIGGATITLNGPSAQPGLVRRI